MWGDFGGFGKSGWIGLERLGRGKKRSGGEREGREGEKKIGKGEEIGKNRRSDGSEFSTKFKNRNQKHHLRIFFLKKTFTELMPSPLLFFHPYIRIHPPYSLVHAGAAFQIRLALQVHVCVKKF